MIRLIDKRGVGDILTHIIVVSSVEEVKAVVDALDLDVDTLSSKATMTVPGDAVAAFVKSSVSKENYRVTISMLNPEIPFNSMRGIAKSIASMSHDVCVHIRYVPERFRVPLMHILGKHCYTFVKYKSKHVKRPHHVSIFDPTRKNAEFMQSIANAISCVDVARNLENEPANRMTPKLFCADATRLLRAAEMDGGRTFNISVLDEKAMAKEGLGLVLSVGQSSAHPPRFMVVEMMSNEAYPTVCLVGKGVTFDAGGLRIKSAPGMADMKSDKSGAAVVVSILCHLARVGIKLNVIGLMPMVENVINGHATKPGDIVNAHNGSNVEIMDPDAEGRLIIADAMSYSTRYRPDYVFDFATLTSFASTICCDLSAVYYTTNDELSQLIYNLGESLGERVWRHPPWPEYKMHTVSPIADTRNAIFECTRGGSFMAAMFISNFVPKDVADRWVHFDISNNEVKGIFSANCALLGMQLLKAIEEVGTKVKSSSISSKTHKTKTKTKTKKRKSNTKNT